MAGKFTALFMAILIGAPFCFCLAEKAPASPVPEAAHACCHQSAQDASTDLPESESPEPCCCQDDSRDQWVIEGDTKPTPPQWTLLFEIEWAPLSELEASSAGDARRALDSPEVSRLSGVDILQAQCRYLL